MVVTLAIISVASGVDWPFAFLLIGVIFVWPATLVVWSLSKVTRVKARQSMLPAVMAFFAVLVSFIVVLESMSTRPDMDGAPAAVVVPSYELVSTEDASLGRVIRIAHKVVVDADLDEAQGLAVAKALVETTTRSRDVNAITVFFYTAGSDIGGPYNKGKITWAPQGEWSKASTASSGSYSSFSYNIEDFDAPEDVIVLPPPPCGDTTKYDRHDTSFSGATGTWQIQFVNVPTEVDNKTAIDWKVRVANTMNADNHGRIKVHLRLADDPAVYGILWEGDIKADALSATERWNLAGTTPYFGDWNSGVQVYPSDKTPVAFYVEVKNALGGYETQVLRGACFLDRGASTNESVSNETA